MSVRRFTSPDAQMGATAFSSDKAAARGALAAVRLLKSQRWLWEILREEVRLDSDYGKKRDRGHWDLAAVAFIGSRIVDIQPWYDETSNQLWRECGFAEKPSYQTAHRRLRELETRPEPWVWAVGQLVQRARQKDERVMAHTHVDSTEDETHAAAYHDCQDGDDCAVRDLPRGPRGRTPTGRGRRALRVSTEVVRASRHQESALPAPDTSAEPNTVQEETMVVRNGRRFKRYRQDGCWFITRDADAGVRAYTGDRGARRVWLGYYHQKIVDHFTGGVAVVAVATARRNEADIFCNDTYDRMIEVIGGKPETVIGDRGFSIAKVFEKLTSNGIAPVFPWRAGGSTQDPRRHDKDRWDRHGVMRCKHCGGPTEHKRFSAAGGKPRLWVVCMLGTTADCAKEQTIMCKEDWRLLVPLARTEPLYHELKQSHEHHEAVHDWERDRYRSGADELGVRPKVCSMAFHQLRANVACLIEWLRICDREGWLTRARRNHGEAVRRARTGGQAAAATLARMHQRMGLGAPYGEVAAGLGIGQCTPPSRRPRGAPPGAPPGEPASPVPTSS